MLRTFIRGATLLLIIPISMQAQQTRRARPDARFERFDRADRALLRETWSPWWFGTSPTLPPGIAKNVARGKTIPSGIAKKSFPRRTDSVRIPVFDERRMDRDVRYRTMNGRVVATRKGAVAGVVPRGPRR